MGTRDVARTMQAQCGHLVLTTLHLWQDTVGQAQASLASAWRAPEVVGVGCHIRMDFLVSCRDGSPGTVSPYT